jgi:hypothetical protein
VLRRFSRSQQSKRKGELFLCRNQFTGRGDGGDHLGTILALITTAVMSSTFSQIRTLPINAGYHSGIKTGAGDATQRRSYNPQRSHYFQEAGFGNFGEV